MLYKRKMFVSKLVLPIVRGFISNYLLLKVLTRQIFCKLIFSFYNEEMPKKVF